MLGKFSASDIDCMEALDSFNCDLASMITMYEIKSMHVLPVTCLTTVHKYTWVTPSFSAYQATYLFCA